MSEKDPRWLQKGLRLLSRHKSKDHGNRKSDDPSSSPVANALSGAAGSAAADTDTAQNAQPGLSPSLAEQSSHPLRAPHIQKTSTQSVAKLDAEPVTAQSPLPRLPRHELAAERVQAWDSEALWDQAYDQLREDMKKDNKNMLDFFERVLFNELDDSSGANQFDQTDRTRRRSQLVYLLQTGLEKTEKRAKVEQKVSDTIKIVLSVKEAIGRGLVAVPVAALAWSGVCVALEVS